MGTLPGIRDMARTWLILYLSPPSQVFVRIQHGVVLENQR